jgi:hypothetical protein
MSKGTHDVFAFMISFFWVMDWQPKDIKIRLFEANETKGHVLARNLI